MPVNDGEEVLDALLLLGYSIEIADDGTITATNGADTLRGKAAMGTIEWSDRSAVHRTRERAYLARLRARVQAGHSAQPANDSPPVIPHSIGIGREETDDA
jgi:hypothetical protein